MNKFESRCIICREMKHASERGHKCSSKVITPITTRRESIATASWKVNHTGNSINIKEQIEYVANIHLGSSNRFCSSNHFGTTKTILLTTKNKIATKKVGRLPTSTAAE